MKGIGFYSFLRSISMQFVDDPKLNGILETINDLIRFRTVEGQFDVFEKTVKYVY